MDSQPPSDDERHNLSSPDSHPLENDENDDNDENDEVGTTTRDVLTSSFMILLNFAPFVVPHHHRGRTITFLSSIFDNDEENDDDDGGISDDVFQRLVEEATQQSLQSFQDEQFRRNEQRQISSIYPTIPIHIQECRNAQCFVCREMFVENEPVVQLNCRHLFHKPCVDEVVMYDPKCPLCKTPIDHVLVNRSEPSE